MAFFRTFPSRFYGFVKKGHFKKWFFVEIDGSFFGILQNDFSRSRPFFKTILYNWIISFSHFQKSYYYNSIRHFQKHRSFIFQNELFHVFSSFCKMTFPILKNEILKRSFSKTTKMRRAASAFIVYNQIVFNMLYFWQFNTILNIILFYQIWLYCIKSYYIILNIVL